MIVRELVTKLAFSTDQKQAQKYERAINGLRRTATLAATAVAGIGAAGTAFVRQYSEASAETLTWANRLGIATDRLQELQFAGQQYRVNQDALIDGLKELSLRADEFAQTGVGPAVEAFERLGLSQARVNELSSDTAALFEEVRSRVEDVDNIAARQRIVDELFGGTAGEQFAEFLAVSSDELEGLYATARDSGFVVPREDLERAREFSRQTSILTATFGGLGKVLASGLLPQYQELIKSTQEWLTANSEAIKSGIKSFVEGLSTAFRSLWWILQNVWAGVDAVAQTFGGWEPTLRMVVTGVAALVGLKLASWIWAAVRGGAVLLLTFGKIKKLLGVGLLVAAIDDLTNWVQGNKSAIGEVLGEWEAFHERFEWFFDNWKTWLGILATLIGVRLVANIIKATKQMRIFGNVGAAAGKKVTVGMGGKGGLLGGISKGAVAKGGLFGALGLGAASIALPLIDATQASTRQAMQFDEAAIAAQGSPVGPRASNSLSMSNQFTFNVEGMATQEDAERVVDLVGEEIDRRTREALRQFPDSE